MVIDLNPFYDFERDMDTLFRSALSNPRFTNRHTSYPLINISEDGANIYVRCELPGVELADLEITLLDTSLSIKGERKTRVGKYYRQERASGVFQRVISLNSPVERDSIEAKLKNGLLEVVLPKAEEVRPRKIAIQA